MISVNLSMIWIGFLDGEFRGKFKFSLHAPSSTLTCLIEKSGEKL